MASRSADEYDPFEKRPVVKPTPTIIATKHEEVYNPFEHRQVVKPTNDWETLANLLKGALGTGTLAIPYATKHAGLWFGALLTVSLGFVLTYCVYLVVRNAQRLCVRMKVPLLTFDQIGEYALLYGPVKLRKMSMWVKHSINFFLMVDLFGCCSVYVVFCAKNLKQIIDAHAGQDFTEREYIMMLLPFALLYVMMRHLKFLAPLSVVANLCIFTGMIIVLYYLFVDLPPIGNLPVFAHIKDYPMYFGVAIFALEAIGVIMPLENNMTNPHHFIQGPCILFIGFSVVVFIYTIVGFFGYWKYGENIEGSVTLNVPQDEVLGQSVKLLFAVAVFQTFAIQFYVPFQIIWRSYTDRFGKWNLLVEYCLRWAICFVCVMIGYSIPSIGAIMSLLGSVCLSFLGIIFPSMIDYAVCHEDPGFGRYKWRLIVDVMLFIFGWLGFIFGTYVAVYDIIDAFVLKD